MYPNRATGGDTPTVSRRKAATNACFIRSSFPGAGDRHLDKTIRRRRRLCDALRSSSLPLAVVLGTLAATPLPLDVRVPLPPDAPHSGAYACSSNARPGSFARWYSAAAAGASMPLGMNARPRRLRIAHGAL